jgi:hypothetical protein
MKIPSSHTGKCIDKFMSALANPVEHVSNVLESSEHVGNVLH